MGPVRALAAFALAIAVCGAAAGSAAPPKAGKHEDERLDAGGIVLLTRLTTIYAASARLPPR